MHQAIAFIKNSFAVLLLFGILMSALVTSMALSPIALPAQQSSVAGVFDAKDGEILSGFIPLEITDLNSNDTQFTSQLVKISDRQFNYFLSLGAYSKQIAKRQFVLIRNYNNAPVTINITASLPTEIQRSVNLAVVSSQRKTSIYNARTEESKAAVIKIDGKSEISLDIEYEYLQNISFNTQAGIQITY